MKRFMPLTRQVKFPKCLLIADDHVDPVAEVEGNLRDEQDMNRETDPLRQAEDAVLVDSTDMTPEQVVDAIIAVVEDVYGKRA